MQPLTKNTYDFNSQSNDVNSRFPILEGKTFGPRFYGFEAIEMEGRWETSLRLWRQIQPRKNLVSSPFPLIDSSPVFCPVILLEMLVLSLWLHRLSHSGSTNISKRILAQLRNKKTKEESIYEKERTRAKPEEDRRTGGGYFFNLFLPF